MQFATDIPHCDSDTLDCTSIVIPVHQLGKSPDRESAIITPDSTGLETIRTPKSISFSSEAYFDRATSTS